MVMISEPAALDDTKGPTALKNAVDVMVNRVKKAEQRIASLEGELNTLHSRMQAASDMLGLPKKKSQGDSGELLKKWLAPAGAKKNVNLQPVKGSDEISKFIQKQESKPQASKQLNVLLDNLLKLRPSEKQQQQQQLRTAARVAGAGPSGAKGSVSSRRSLKQEARKGGVKKVVTVSKGRGSPFLDPLTLREIVDPVINAHCKHVYERATIYKLIAGRTDVTCPYPKCYNPVPVHMSNLQVIRDGRKRVRGIKRA